MFQESEPIKRLCEAEVDNFFAEIDALGIPGESTKTNDSGNKLESSTDSPPLPPPPPPPPPPPQESSNQVSCQWSEFTDPQTEFVYYYNSSTHETTWTMPEELKEFKGISGEAVESETRNKKTMKSLVQSKEVSKSGDEIEYLQEYVANTDSCSASDDSTSEKALSKNNGVSSTSKINEDDRKHRRNRKRKKSRDKRSHSKRKKQKKEKLQLSSEEDENLIGPKLPSKLKTKINETDVKEDKDEDKETIADLENLEMDPGNSSRFIGPRLPPSDSENPKKADTIPKEKSKEETGNCDSSQYEEAQDELSEAIREQSSMLLNKLQFLNVTRDSLPLLTILFIKLETRFEDWSSGALTLERMVSALNETMVEMTNYENSAVPDGWKCFWDNSTNRYYYENQVTKDCQWEYPTDPVSVPEKTDNQPEENEAEEVSGIQELEASQQQSPCSQEDVAKALDNEEDNNSRTTENILNDNDQKSNESSDEEIIDIDSYDRNLPSLKSDTQTTDEEGKVESNVKEVPQHQELLLIEELDENEVPSANEDAITPPRSISEFSETLPTTTSEIPKVNMLRLVAYDDDDDSESLSEDDASQGSIVNTKTSKDEHLSNPALCHNLPSNDRPTNLLPNDLILTASMNNVNQSPSSHQSVNHATEEDDMEVDSDDDGVNHSVINVAPLPPPPPPPLPLLPARPLTPPPPPPPPPLLRSTICAVPQPPKSTIDFHVVARPTTVTFEPPPQPPPPAPTSSFSVMASSTISAPEPPPQPVPDSTEDLEDDQSSSTTGIKRKKQKMSKNKIGLKGMQNLFQKWQQVQENL